MCWVNYLNSHIIYALNHTDVTLLLRKQAFPSSKIATGVRQDESKLPSVKAYFVEVDEEHVGQRLDNFLITHLKGVPRTHIYRIIRKGEVRVNKGRARQTTRLQLGDKVRIPPVHRAVQDPALVDGTKYEFLNRATLFEDDALLIINKPSGMAVHAGSGIKVGVIEALRVLRTDIKYLELVHRLDRETSGCLVLAKKSSVLKALHEDFKNNSLKTGRLDKRYLALVRGRWKHGERRVTKALNTNSKRHGERIVVVDDKGSYASSIMSPIDTAELASLIEVKLLTGRTHQVRVHALAEGHPVAGDQKYGAPEFNKLMKNLGLSRLFLHATTIQLIHPVSQQVMRFAAPLPAELTSVLDQLHLGTN
ncbi:MAG: RluA family pseudouridine synthase [Gammaproteobacteria bacterium]|nr:RluA family pseudouridine synthase [Gammaproteobacteria bacterium]